MIRGLHGLLYSSDADASRAFIRDMLRLPFTDTGDGWLIFEWEKRWHPEIEDPGEAFPHFIETVREYLAG